MFRRRSSPFPRPLLALLIVLLALAWVLFAPTQLGGQASYVIINGNSMEPLYHRGDLVILRQTDQPGIGDIFAYRYPDIGSVIHRIIDIEGNRFVFKGDHNASVDGYQPAFEELIGKAWIHIPDLGNTVLLLRQPLPFALLVGSVGGFLMFGLIFDSSRQPDKKKKPWLKRFNFPQLPSMPDQSRESVIFILSLILFASGVLAIFAFSSPVSISRDDNIEYTHLTVFRYTAPANPQVYDRATIQSGDPVFVRLNCSLDVVVNYTLVSGAVADVGGSYRVFASLSEFNGWKRILELVPATAFTGSTFSYKVSMDICAVHKMVDDMVSLTGLTRSTYSVALITQVDLTGKIGNRAYQEQISPSLNFAMDDSQLYLVRDETSGADPLNLTRTGLIPGKREEANTLSVLGLKLPVLLARILSALGILGCLAALIVYGLSMYRNAVQDELAAIRLKYAPVLAQVDGLQPKRKTSAAPKVIDVKSMADLARIAQNAGSMILEQDHEMGEEHHFLVLSEPYIYRYILHPVKKDATDEAL